MLTGTWRKATYSNSFANCLQARWHASAHCQNGECAEARRAGGVVQVRDSRLGGASPVLSFTPAAWQAFLDGIKAA
jgi:Domain of unknown function (DUF397)